MTFIFIHHQPAAATEHQLRRRQLQPSPAPPPGTNHFPLPHFILIPIRIPFNKSLEYNIATEAAAAAALSCVSI